MPDAKYGFSDLLVVSLVILGCSLTVQAQEASQLLEYSLEELGEIRVITPSKRLQGQGEAPATIYVITAEDIKHYGYRDLKDVLQNLPGIEYANAHSNLQGGQRGFAENWAQTKLLINGRPMNKLWSGEAYIASQYTLNNVMQIEIVQGPASALYGADAFTGVINIITKNSENSDPGSDIATSLGSVDETFDSKQFSFNTISQNKNLGMTLSGTVFNQNGPDFTDFVRTAKYTEDNIVLRNEMLDNGNPYRDNNRAYNINADFMYEIDTGANINAGVYFLRDEDGGGIESPEISFTNFSYISEQILTYFKLENEFDSYPIKLTLDVFREDEDDYIHFQNREDEGDNPPYIAAFNVEGSRSYTVNAQFDITPKRIPNYLILGLGYYSVNIGEPAFTGLSTTDTTLGAPTVGRYYYPPVGYFSDLKPYLNQEKYYVYVQDQHSFLDNKLQLTLGGRYDHHNIYGDVTNIRSGLYYQFAQGWAVKVLYGEAFREPTMYEFTETPDLVPARMKTRELSLHFNPTQNISGQLVYFQNHATKIIEEAPTVEDILVNSGSKKVDGIEALLKWRYAGLRGNVWYNYERDPDDPQFKEIAKNKVGFGIIYDIKKNVSLSLQGKYTDSIKGNALDNNLNPITITIPEYKSFNLTLLAQRIKTSTFPDIDLSFSIYNLFDTTNYYPDVRGANPSRYLEEGRSFYISGRLYY
jgi:outer membrane receptor for ferrienterochelin and colicins